MTHEEKGTSMEAVVQPVFERGFDGIGEVLSAVLNFAMLIEREKAQGAQPYEASLLRLVSAVLSEISEEWETGKIDLNTEDVPA